MELGTWLSENMAIWAGVPLLIVALLIPLLIATRGQRGGRSKTATGGDSAYAPIVPDSAGGSVDAN